MTDPPYGVQYDPGWRNKSGASATKRTGKVLNDDRADWREAWALFPGDVAYVWHGALHATTVEAGQLRGVSRFARAIVKLFTLDLYDDAELERKKTAAMFAMFITSPAPETPLEPADEDLEVEPGQVVRLDPGEDVTTPATPDSGATYEPFQYRTLLQISAALGIP